VEQSNLLFICPLNSTGDQEPQVSSSTGYEVKCKICGLLEGEDTDPTEGRITTNLRFGPNTLEGTIHEQGVLSYSVFVVDECFARLGDALGSVAAEPGLYENDTCCQSDAYEITVTIDLPYNVSEVQLMVVPNTDAGLLSVGAITGFVTDDMSGVPEIKKGSSSHAMRCWPCAGLLLAASVRVLNSWSG
jgi:hypothetical protein